MKLPALPESLLGKSWSTPDGDVTSEHLFAVLEAVASRLPRATAISGAMGNCDRRVDRATQLLRKAGLIEFVGGTWRLALATRLA